MIINIVIVFDGGVGGQSERNVSPLASRGLRKNVEDFSYEAGNPD
jgi:hypothetical protein